MQKLQLAFLLLTVSLPAALNAEKYFDKFITTNSNLYFRTYLNYVKSALMTWHSVEWQRYTLLYNGSVQVQHNCIEAMNNMDLKSVSIYQFDIDNNWVLSFLHQRLVMLFPSTKLPLQKDSDYKKIDFVYPVFPEVVEVARYNDNGFWFKIINGTNFVNRYNIKVNVKAGQGPQFQKALEKIMNVTVKEYENDCPVKTRNSTIQNE